MYPYVLTSIQRVSSMSTYGVRVSNNFRSIHASEVGLVDESQQQNK